MEEENSHLTKWLRVRGSSSKCHFRETFLKKMTSLMSFGNTNGYQLELQTCLIAFLILPSVGTVATRILSAVSGTYYLFKYTRAGGRLWVGISLSMSKC